MHNYAFKHWIQILFIFALLNSCALLHHTYKNMGIIDGASDNANFLKSKFFLLYQGPDGNWLLGKARIPLFENKYRILDLNYKASIFILQLTSKNSDALYLYETDKKSMRTVSPPKSSASISLALLSPSSEDVALVTKSISSDGKDLKDDRLYLLDLKTLSLKELPQLNKQISIGSLAWSKDGNSLYYQELGFLGYRILKQTKEAKLPLEVYETLLQPDWNEHLPEEIASAPLNPRKSCEGNTLQLLNEREGRTQDKLIQLQQAGKKFETILKITDRERSCPDCEGFIALKLQFSPDCKAIFFSLGDTIMAYDIATKQLGRFAKGEQLILLPE